MSTGTSTGYGPRARLIFDGDEQKYELWEVKFLGYMRLQKLLKVIIGEETDTTKNEEAFAELVQCLDDRSLSLIIRDAKDDGKKALEILREYYLGKSKPRIISLYTELTSLKKGTDENVTDYIIRAETAATSLKTAGETISDSLLVAMVLKGLPVEYKTFSTVVAQKDKIMSFSEFKVALRSFEETEKCQQAHSSVEDSVMNIKPRQEGVKCHFCGKLGHRQSDCWIKAREENKAKGKQNRWCEHCKSHTHDTKYCRKKNNTVKTVTDNTGDDGIGGNENSHSFAFKANSYSSGNSKAEGKISHGLLVDCGATTHIINDKNKFVKLNENFNSATHFIELADGSRKSGIVSAKGDARVILCDKNGNQHKVMLKDALYIPSYNQDIFSVQAATERGASVSFSQNKANLKAENGTVFDIEQHGKLYYLNNVNSSKVGKHSLKEWHEILGHRNVNDVLKLECVVNGMKITDNKKFDCDICTLGKMTQYINRSPDKRATSPLDFVHCDLAGPIEPMAREGFRYALSFVDDYSGLIMVYFLKQKSDTLVATEKYLADISPYGAIKRLRCDNGGEFSSAEFKTLIFKNKIKQEFTAPDSPHQNGTVERSWRSLFDMARCLVLQAKLPKNLWTYAVKAAAYICNRCYNPRTTKTPFEIFTNEKPNISNMHVFGTKCFAYIQDKKKLDNRSRQGVFVGYDSQSPAYLVYFPDKHDIKRVRCVKFSETLKMEEEQNDIEYGQQRPLRKDVEDQNQINAQEETETSETETSETETSETETNETEEQNRRYPQREHKKPAYLSDYVAETKLENVATCHVDYCYRVTNIPNTYQEAISSDECQKWQEAMKEEMTALKDNNTYELTKLPEGRTLIKGRWVYAIKISPNTEEKFKARYVAKGYSQVENIDYHETFAPTARMTSIRMLMQIVVQDNFTVHQMNAKTAYLNADIDCEIYMEQPEGFVQFTDKNEKLVCKLKKSLYGLKQSGRNWNNLLHSFLLSENFEQSIVALSYVSTADIDTERKLDIFCINENVTFPVSNL